ncbi:MAG TPA: UDP-N-acetylmuramoyl-tripeptide--D-alanyl-D-alanine ligase [Candidatus Binatia bacterium]|nr:UDP-N-acetylmuramoyl-tripeptide--D-alanyl-D-alanine ligase [Candidatus Binatia bacterium]
MSLPLEIAIAATGARLHDAAAAPERVRATTDTRTLEAGDTFVALHGERFDGHDFVAEAARRGAAMLVVDRPDRAVAGVATAIVADTKAAYMALAGAARALFRGRVVAITGSAGKTTTKELLAALLVAKYGERVAATPENENNEIGVSKLLLAAANESNDVVIAELGARRFGDIAALVEIVRPQLGILTNVGEAHLEIMGSRRRLEETKWSLFALGARAILNARDEVSRRRAGSLAHPPVWFAGDLNAIEHPSGLEPLIAFDGATRLVRRDRGATIEYEVDVRLPGLHNRANLAAAVAGALELGVAVDEIVRRIPCARLPHGRYDRIALAGGVALIYDAYNANASGTIAALDAFAAETAGRRIAVLAGMAELGEESAALHERVGEHAAGSVDLLLLVQGEHAGDLASGAERGGLGTERIVRIETNADAARWLREHARPDDVVLLKGSRKYKLEEIVEELRS